MQCGKPLESFLRYRKTKNKGPGALQAQWGATSAERTTGRSAGSGPNKKSHWAERIFSHFWSFTNGGILGFSGFWGFSGYCFWTVFWYLCRCVSGPKSIYHYWTIWLSPRLLCGSRRIMLREDVKETDPVLRATVLGRSDMIFSILNIRTLVN